MSTTERKIDWKAVERGEQKVRRKAGAIAVAEVRIFSNGYVGILFQGDPWPCNCSSGELASQFELVPPEPKRLTVWLNLYSEYARGPYMSREGADCVANGSRLECRDITWTVPR